MTQAANNNVSTIFSPSKRAPYNFDPGFERSIAFLVATRPAFLPKLGGFLDAEGFLGAEAKLAIQASLAIAKDDPTSRGPSGIPIVLQRLRRWMTDGKITLAQIQAVHDALYDVGDAGEPDEEQVLGELKPVLVKRAEFEALDSAAQNLTRGEDILAPMAKVARARAIGAWVQAASETFTDDPVDVARLASMQCVERLKTGIMELDLALDGGLGNGTLTTFLGETNSGKSQQLVYCANAARWAGEHTAYATLEMPVFDVQARVHANLTGLPTNAIREDRVACGVDAALARLIVPGRGRLFYRHFTARVAKVGDILTWITELEKAQGITIRVLVVDYADEVSGGAVGKGGEENTYQSAGNVYADLFTWAVNTGRWVITASQAVRRGKRAGGGSGMRAKLDVNDIADSMKKVRRADYVITLNPEDDDSQMVWLVAKARGSRRGQVVGPLPTDFSCARIAPVVW